LQLETNNFPQKLKTEREPLNAPSW
jgi:hypothetical protein